MDLDALAVQLRTSRGLAHKRDIADVVQALGVGAHSGVPVGDDCAAIPDGDGGYQLLAIEGFIAEFVKQDPWFAGWCGVMVNVSDIAAMGGRATAVVNALWGRGAEHLRPLLAGMAAAAKAYGVPVVGGHSNARSTSEQLAVAILGHATRLLTSFAARPGDVLVCAIDLRGRYREPWSHWNCSDGVDPERLRGDLEILPALAEEGLCEAAKDISQAGVLGTTMMLLECSGVGATLSPDAVPRPAGVDPVRWLVSTFPSYGFVLAVPPAHARAVMQRFQQRGIACAPIGRCTDHRKLDLADDERRVLAWDFREQAVIGCGPAAATPEPAHA